jgi:hypothetical protein
MPNHLSILGIIHTAISILALIAAIVAFVKHGKITPGNVAGKSYIGLTAITCLTALPIMKTGHPTPGHPLAVIILLLLPLAVYAPTFKLLKKSGEYLQTVLMSLTVFFSMIPATVETLTRLPISAPLATDPADPLIKGGLTLWAALFIVGTGYQLVKIKKGRAVQGEHIAI